GQAQVNTLRPRPEPGAQHTVSGVDHLERGNSGSPGAGRCSSRAIASSIRRWVSSMLTSAVPGMSLSGSFASMQPFLPLLGVLQVPEGSPDAVRRIRLVENYCIFREIFEQFGKLSNRPSKF